MEIAAVVPSLNPDKCLTEVIKGLIGVGFTRIYVINDGSDDAHLAPFAEAEALSQCVVIHHDKNYGKGRALKTAFARHLESPGEYTGLVTLDGDGQHTPEDTLRVAQALLENPHSLALGARDFSKVDVPAKSAFGNKLTRSIFKLAYGMPITDTQTGLRGIPNDFAQALLDVKGDRYEFETNMLLETKPNGVSIIEIPISTIYLDNNAASHFRPLADSVRIYARILKYTASSLLSFLVDFGLFALLNWLFRSFEPELRFLIATVGARACSGFFNFMLNKKVVFKSTARTSGALLRYFALLVIQAATSYAGVYLLSGVLFFPDLLSKILVDTTLFFVSYFIQRRWVFRATRGV